MSFLKLILKNPFRSKSRAILAIIGIGIGIATIVALGAMTEGMVSGVDDTLHAGGSDFTVAGNENNTDSGMSQQNMASFGATPLNQSWVGKILNVTGVNSSVGIYSTMVQPQGLNGYLVVIGLDPSQSKFAELTITNGTSYHKNTSEMIMGKLSAEQLNKTVGDNLTLKDKTYHIVGTYETGDSNQDQGVYTSLENAQNIDDAKGNVSMIYVKVDKGADVDQVTQRIDNLYSDNVTTISSVSDISSMQSVIDMLNSASWAISLLAIIIGGLGIINTMLMSVMERTREIGVLKAVGWSSKKILLMIMGESVVITVISAIVGTIMGVIGVELITAMGIMNGLTPIFTITTISEAFAVAIIVGLLGGLYPAIKATKLQPTEALRYE
ncbi:ABC transporter permease [Methanobrevibacter sp. UBA412]|jgi:putative ABC transport system permease protein|uniref:ABC transporter permease n=2 Tax=unclassified Methanobrevibacter TaxID=2638681 RepID=UPI0039B9B571